MEAGCKELVPLVDGGELRLAHDGELFHEAEPAAVGGGAIMLYKGNHWTRCAGFMDASWVRLGITNDDLGTSWALPGDNLGMTWG